MGRKMLLPYSYIVIMLLQEENCDCCVIGCAKKNLNIIVLYGSSYNFKLYDIPHK